MAAQEMREEDHEQAVRPPARVLLLYAESSQVPDLMQCLSQEGYDVISCPVSATHEPWTQDLQPDLVLLLPPHTDVALLQACEAARASTEQPLLVLSEEREELLVANALASGVDEYLSLPMGNRELAARIGAMLRRMRRTTGPNEVRDLGALRLNPDDHSVQLHDRNVALSPLEFRLLSCLASTPGRVVSHLTLMSRVWGEEYVDSRNYLRLYIRYLREKLEEAGNNPRMLLNLRKRMAKIRVFDPACGSGNFLVIAYKEMRAIDAEINKRRDEAERRTGIPLTNFRGIELRDFPAEIAYQRR